jgi:nucleoside-diphosphate-sugar epimerase
MIGLPLIETEEALVEQMTAPSAAVVEAVGQLNGDILILGVGGKMGPTLAELLVRAGARKVIGVSRFSSPEHQRHLEDVGVKTLKADLLGEEGLAALPEAPYLFLLAGYKFGATGNEPTTWAMNTWLPGKVLARYPEARIVYVSSGNVYSYTSAAAKGSREEGELGPIGEYAQSRLGGERVAEYLCRKQATPLAVIRLFYATELRYGIIHDIAWKVSRREPIDLAMGHVNQIWQGDANACLARSFPLCSSPSTVINLGGLEVLSVRWIARQLGAALGQEPIFVGEESDTALLSEASKMLARFGAPAISADQIIAWMAHWVRSGGTSLGKPTRYESRSGKF